MEVILIMGWVVGVLALLYALRCRIELKRWANLVQSARIAVSYKRKVQLQAPLSEWALWARELDKKKENGQVVYVGGGTRVAIIKALPQKVTRNNRDTSPARQGKWQATDQTERNGTKTD